MRDTDQPQPVPGLGKKIERPAMPEPYVKVREGIYRSPDGKLETQIPTPPPKQTSGP